MPKPKRTKKPSEPKPKLDLSKLTGKQKQLVLHPPTPRTWRCTKKREKEGARTECGMVNSGRQSKCLLCGASKPSKPKLLWPDYLAACAKAGIEPKGQDA